MNNLQTSNGVSNSSYAHIEILTFHSNPKLISFTYVNLPIINGTQNLLVLYYERVRRCHHIPVSFIRRQELFVPSSSDNRALVNNDYPIQTVDEAYFMRYQYHRTCLFHYFSKNFVLALLIYISMTTWGSKIPMLAVASSRKINGHALTVIIWRRWAFCFCPSLKPRSVSPAKGTSVLIPYLRDLKRSERPSFFAIFLLSSHKLTFGY